MRRLICFLLVLILCMSMTCTAFAAAPSPGEGGVPPHTPETNIPKTGDLILRWVILMVISLIALAVILILGRKIFKK